MGAATTPAMDDSITIDPPPCSAMTGSTSWLSRHVLVRLVLITLFQTSRGNSWMGAKTGFTAALATSTSMRP